MRDGQWYRFGVTSVLACSLVVSSIVAPFERAWDNWLDLGTLTVLLVLVAGVNDSGENDLAFQWFAAAVTLLCIAVLVGAWLVPLVALGIKRCRKHYAQLQ